MRKQGLEARFILQSSDYRTIDALHDTDPRIRTCLLKAPKSTHDYLPLLRQHHASCIALSPADVDAGGVGDLKKAGIMVYSGVADARDDWKNYADLGVDAVLTNDPEGLIAFLKRSGLRQ